MKKKKVAILGGHSISPNMESVLGNWGRMLSGEFDLQLIVSGGFRSTEWSSSYKVHEVQLPVSGPASIFYAWGACRNYLREEPETDLLINVGQPTLASAVAHYGKQYGIPAIVRYTGDPREAGLGRNPYERFKSWLIQGKVGQWACGRADRILTLGTLVKKKLVERGFDPDNITALPQPFDPEPFKSSSSSDSNLRAELGLHPEKKILLYVGRLSWLKGADRLLRIVEYLGNRKGDYQFCFIGKGPYEREFTDFKEGFVKTPGRVSHEEIARYYRASDMFLLPSRAEGLPNVVLEALAADLPVIASPIGEIPTYVSNLAEDTEDFLEYVLEESWKKDPLPEYFDWDNQKGEYVDLFKSVIEGV